MYSAIVREGRVLKSSSAKAAAPMGRKIKGALWEEEELKDAFGEEPGKVVEEKDPLREEGKGGGGTEVGVSKRPFERGDKPEGDDERILGERGEELICASCKGVVRGTEPPLLPSLKAGNEIMFGDGGVGMTKSCEP